MFNTLQAGWQNQQTFFAGFSDRSVWYFLQTDIPCCLEEKIRKIPPICCHMVKSVSVNYQECFHSSTFTKKKKKKKKNRNICIQSIYSNQVLLQGILRLPDATAYLWQYSKARQIFTSMNNKYPLNKSCHWSEVPENDVHSYAFFSEYPTT